jgi:NAD(P)-dependent dehydrogenase (short-subunit alcohol dehydrogenase family)
VITGGGRGIGESITTYFHGQGDRVVIGSRVDSGLASDLGDRALFHKTDVRYAAESLRLIDRAVQWSGQADVLINNAGFSGWRSLSKIEESFWDDMIDTNLKGTLFACQAAVPRMSEGSSIINVSSLAGKRGSANNSVYCGSKFGVNGITQSLAKELGKLGIRVNAVCPVYVRTEGLDAALGESQSPAAGQEIESYMKDFATSNAALGRMPKGEEVASTCYFLASDHAAAITGQCINVDCGVLPQ